MEEVKQEQTQQKREIEKINLLAFKDPKSPVAEAYDELYESYSTDEELYEGTRAGWKEMFLETMFPSAETLNRCGVMKDFGDGKNAVITMWAAVQ